jgi:DNA-binding response OmpR family regulator
MGKTPYTTGSMFTLNFCGMTDETISPTREPAKALLRSQISPRHRILVVDDDTKMRQLNTAALTQAGYHVDGAPDGAAGFEALQTKRYDLVITDNFMPKVTGMEMLKKLHAAQLALSVILATRAAPTEAFARQPELQPDITLLKPYTTEQMLNAVELVLRIADTRLQGPPLPKEKHALSSYGLEII